MAGLAKPRNLMELIKSSGLQDVDTTRKQGLKDILDQLQLSAGMNLIFPVNNCEAVADFDESTDGEFDVAIESSTYKVGTYSIKLTATTATSGYVSTEDIVNSGPIPTDVNTDQFVDWDDIDYVGWWQYNAGFNTAGELTFRIKNNGTWSAAQSVAGGTDSVWQRVEVDISALARHKVEAIRFDNEAPINEYIYIDDIIRYKHGNGKGPVLGPCLSYPIKSGVTLARGNICEMELAAVRRIDLESAAAVETLGPCVVGGVGNANGTVWGTVQIGGLAYLRSSGTIVNGEGVAWASGHEIVGATNGEDEKNFAKAMEGGSSDEDILCLIAKAVTYIS